MPTGVYTRTEYHRRRISETHPRRDSMTKEQRKKIGEINKIKRTGHVQTEETKLKRGIYNKGKLASHWKGGHDKAVLSKRWKQKNRERNLLLNHNYRARRLNAEGELTLGEWLEIKKRNEYRCVGCSKHESESALTVDHIVPLSKGGTNHKDNIQPLCKSCNSKKRTMDNEHFINTVKEKLE